MRKLLFLWIFLGAIGGANAQNIVQAEHFIDTDPGFGNATQVSFSPASNVTLSFSVNISGLPNGFHTFYFRTKDVNGRWSVLNIQTFYTSFFNVTPPTADITRLEYYFDIDPGFGNATNVTITPGTSIEKSFSVDLTALNGGFHTMYVRTLNADGLWTVINSVPFYRVPDAIVDPLADIVTLEYFVDQDPGFGNATNVAITPGPTITPNFAVDLTNVSGGFHTLYIRTRDADGLWNVVQARPFYRLPDAIVDPLAIIIKMEYFVDIDPGFGNGTNVGITPGTNISQPFAIDLTGLSGGFHTLYVRIQDADGFWNVVQAKPFYRLPDAIVDPLADIVKLEYFLDNDPGFGNATNVAITPGPNITPNFVVDLTNVSGGFHTLYIRTRDADGLWNVIQAKPFYRVPDAIVDPLADIVKLEYFVDTDPGFGNATNVSITPGPSITPSFAVDLTNLSGGFHTLYIRTRDADGLWNVINSAPFYRTPGTVAEPLPNLTALDYFFSKDGVNTPVFSYSGFTPDSNITVNFSPGTFGLEIDSSYDIRMYARDSNGRRGIEFSQSFIAPDSPPAAPQNLVATAGTGQVYLKWNKNTELDFLRYRIYRGTIPNPITRIDSTSLNSDTTRVIPNLTNGITYYFRVTAVDSILGESSFSNEVNATPFFVVQNPPVISSSVYQNPVLSKYIDIVVVTDSTLQQSPTVRVTVGPDTTGPAIPMNLIAGATRAYRGSYAFSQNGLHTIYTRVLATNGISATHTRTFTGALAKPGIETLLVTSDGKARIRIPDRAVVEETYFLSESQQQGNETIYRFGPTKELQEFITVEFSYEPGAFPDEGKLFIFGKQEGEWEPIRSQVYPASNQVRARVGQLGEFKLIYDVNFQGTNVVPSVFSLKQNYPNPFNPTTTIAYEIPEDGQLAIIIYNMLGQKVRTLFEGPRLAGSYQIQWDGKNEQGLTLSSGIYFYQIRSGKFVQTKKMVLMK